MAQKVYFERGTTEEIEELPIKDGTLIYNVENGKTYMDYGDNRIPTGGGSGGIYIGNEEPEDMDIKLYIDEKENQDYDLMSYRNSQTGNWESLNLPPTGDTLPVGTIIEYDGDEVPYGYEEVSDSNEYSTQEQRIGTYNGKPLYRRIITGTSTKTTERTDIKNIEKIVNYYGICRVAGQSYAENGYRPFPYVANSGGSQFVLNSYNNNRITFSSYWDSNWYEITIEYTKTTD